MWNKIAKSVISAALFVLPVSIPVSANEEITPLPIDYWAVRSAMSSVSLSPDGKQVAFMVIKGKTANPIIEVHKVDALGDDPVRINASKMEFTFLQWVGDDYLLIGARQQVRRRIEDVNQGTYETRVVAYNVREREWITLANNSFGAVGIASLLPSDPDSILIQTFDTPVEGLANADFFRADYYKFNLKTGRRTTVIRGNDKNAQASFDDNGNPRFSQGYDAGSRDFVYYYRDADDTSWNEIYRVTSLTYDEQVSFVGWDENDPNVLFAFAYNGEDRQGYWKFDISQKKFTEKVYQHPEVDLLGRALDPNPWDGDSKVVGIQYGTDKVHMHWFDQEMKALYQEVERAIPNAYYLDVQTSRDESVYVISNIGPRDPGSYYLLNNGQLSYLGGAKPHIKPTDLADVKFIKYPTRDGDEIPAYLTVPNTEGPWPLIVLPHGGPHVTEVIVYDEWSQFLANNGYLVMQPQYRGSRNWGLDHWQKAFAQWGYLMADDKDDGVKYLVEQGMTEADKVAMFGWSYGGYAALAAAARSDLNVYQCVISGAPVSDLPQARADFAKGIEASERYIDETYDGMNPLAEAEKIDMPVLLVHGDVDQRVPYYHATRMDKKMRRLGKDFKLLTLEKADHFSNTLFYDHKKTLYTEMIDWLDNRCGPNGLKN